MFVKTTWKVRSVATRKMKDMGAERLELHIKSFSVLQGVLGLPTSRAAGRRPVKISCRDQTINAGVRMTGGKNPYIWIGTSGIEGDDVSITDFLLDLGFQPNQSVDVEIQENEFRIVR